MNLFIAVKSKFNLLKSLSYIVIHRPVVVIGMPKSRTTYTRVVTTGAVVCSNGHVIDQEQLAFQNSTYLLSGDCGRLAFNQRYLVVKSHDKACVFLALIGIRVIFTVRDVAACLVSYVRWFTARTNRSPTDDELLKYLAGSRSLALGALGIKNACIFDTDASELEQSNQLRHYLCVTAKDCDEGFKLANHLRFESNADTYKFSDPGRSRAPASLNLFSAPVRQAALELQVIVTQLRSKSTVGG